MLLYYSPGACSLADHIALQEADMKFDLMKVDLKTHELENGQPFNDINPKGYVPALKLDDGELLTENVAILSWISDACPSLAPKGSMGRARLLEMLAFISTEIHKSFKPVFAPDASDAEKKKAVAQIEKRLQFLATRMTGPYLFGDRATVADAYLFVMLTWAAENNITVPETLKALAQRMRTRPTVQAALREEGLSH